MKKIISVAVIFLAAFLMSGCGPAKLSPKEQAYIDKKEVLYTQVSMWSEKSRIIATNYSRGTFIPVNTPVVITGVSSNTITFKLKDEEIVIKNVAYTKVNINKLLERTFATTKVKLSKFTAAEQKSILMGQVNVGMSKEAVIVARGYPPAHRTPSLDSNSWRYWVNRFVTTVYNFKDNKVSSIGR